MNVFTQLFSVALNLIMAPFGPNGVALPPSKFNCATNLLKLGDNVMKTSFAPRGYCPNCCPVTIHRDIRYTLYTTPNQGIPIEPLTKGALRQAGLNATTLTTIFIHGFSESSPGKSGQAMINAYLSLNQSRNVILLDWSELSTFPWYKPAVTNVKFVANSLKNFLELYQSSGELPIENVDLVGFSLGAHIAGFAGKRLRKGMRLQRITALDPAMPEFSVKDTSRRLDKSDAVYVEVIHTDGGGLGLPMAVGHADFYPNGGRAIQPGCQPSTLASLRLIDQMLACSHIRAWKLFAEAVKNPKNFPATKCLSWLSPNKKCNFTQDAFMGSGDNRPQGLFYLSTNAEEPFGRGEKHE